MAELLQAKELHIPDNIEEHFARVDFNGHTLEDIIVEMGAVRDREKIIMSVGMIPAFREMLEIDRAIKKKKEYDPDMVSNVIFGFAMSYVLGNFDWKFDEDGKAYILPDIPEAEFFTSGENKIKLRSGKVREAEEVAEKIKYLFATDSVTPVFDLAFKKNILGQYTKMPDVINILNILFATFITCDQKVK